MARPPQDAIDTFVSITGATEAVALRKLEEHGGDLNGAVNAYFNEGERTNVNSSAPPVVDDDFMNIDDPVDVEPPLPALPLLSSAQNLNPFALFNSSFGRNYFDSEGINDFSHHGPRVSHPRDVRQVPIEFKDGDTQPASSGYGPRIEEITESVPENGQTDHTGTENAAVIIDDDDDDDDYVPSAVDNHGFNHRISSGRHPGPSVAPSVDVVDYNNDIEEEMLRAAIEASKQDAEGYSYQQSDVPHDPVGHSKSPVMADSEFARAVSMSIETAERERTLRNQGVQTAGPSSNSSDAKLEDVGKAPAADGRQGFIMTNTELSKSLVKEGDPSVQEETEELDEQPLVRHRSRRFSSGSVESAKTADSPPSSPQYDDISSQPNGDSFPSEWGGISSEEHDEAVMLEAAIFGGIPESSTYRYAYPPLQSGSDTTPNLYPRMPRPPSPNLTAQRLLREQQDDEYLAALQADREKELKAIQEAERRRLEEAAAKEAAVEKEKLEKEEARLRLIEQEEFERTLAAKEASLPQEPSSDDENAVTLLIRMPDGSRRGRRFLKSNKLQFLFDYIDVGRVVKPGTYRLVRPYPRRAFADGESNLSLSELGLTSKQEALFLELI